MKHSRAECVFNLLHASMFSVNPVPRTTSPSASRSDLFPIKTLSSDATFSWKGFITEI